MAAIRVAENFRYFSDQMISTEWEFIALTTKAYPDTKVINRELTDPQRQTLWVL